ncbi:MAG: hypothetical protein ACI4WU_03970 [Bacilli bacterium]
MNKLFIYEYINRLTKDDIIRFGLNQGIELLEYEVDTIYSYIKNDYLRFFDDPETVLLEVRYKVRDITYKKIMELYNKYKNFIN